ncbi:uncharacterized protein ATC70_003434 [Mucor velutinosus]|uniref:Uncharacterized protein n=1 Tax=Mucor velutinosus TaxID=708070 RepID=A0AAN7D9K3_9FUNG|nr:hypothetical protein ATC70_003434 [Mucor velutinosus]
MLHVYTDSNWRALNTDCMDLSLFFASFSFMNKSRKLTRRWKKKEQTSHSKVAFFSYFSAPATIVFGVINVLFVLVLLYGYTLHVIYRSVNRYRQYAKLFACFVSAILIDMFVNCILFAVKKDEFIRWCTNRSADAFQNSTAFALDTQTVDTLGFNCYKLHDTEVKLSFMFLVFFVFVFGFWASQIVNDSRNFVMIRPEISIHPPRTSKVNSALPTHIEDSNTSSVMLSSLPPSAKNNDASIILL